MRDLTNFTACSRETSGLPGAELAALELEIRSAHPEAGFVQTCQRIEAFSLSACECTTPVRRVGNRALEYLATLAAGLESAVLGEYQVLGQVRAGIAPLRQHVPWIDDALAAARQLRAEAGFHATTGRLLDLALKCAELRPAGSLLVVGAGAAGRDVARCGLALGFTEVWITSRRRPEPPVEGVAGWIPLAKAAESARYDVVAACLGPSASTLKAADLPAADLHIDLGSPPNLDPGVHPTIDMQTIIAHVKADSVESDYRESLRTKLRENLARRLSLAAEDAGSPVGLLRLQAERVRHREARRIARLNPEIPADAVDRITRGLVNQLLHAPSVRLREVDDPELAERLAALFVPLEGDQ